MLWVIIETNSNTFTHRQIHPRSPEVEIGSVYGPYTDAEKDAAMIDFRAKEDRQHPSLGTLNHIPKILIK